MVRYGVDLTCSTISAPYRMTVTDSLSFTDASCAQICSGHGECVPRAFGQASCQCDPGFRGSESVPDASVFMTLFRTRASCLPHKHDGHDCVVPLRLHGFCGMMRCWMSCVCRTDARLLAADARSSATEAQKALAQDTARAPEMGELSRTLHFNTGCRVRSCEGHALLHALTVQSNANASEERRAVLTARVPGPAPARAMLAGAGPTAASSAQVRPKCTPPRHLRACKVHVSRHQDVKSPLQSSSKVHA